MQRLNLLTPKKREIALDPSVPITFKSYKVVAQALSQRGKILGKKYTGLSTRTQEKVKKAIKRAQFFGLLRYADMKFQRKSLTRQAGSLIAAD
jgi:small subunit ribosomal protein S18